MTDISLPRALATPESEATNIAPKRFHLFGYPIAHSAAPVFHNECFAARGQPHYFSGWSTSAITSEILDEIRGEACGGAAVTMPLKNAILEHLDELTPASQVTGACNTIIKVRRADGGIKLVGTNTDVLGIRNALLQTLKAQHSTHAAFANGGGALRFEPGVASAMIIGGGATTRSAIYALNELGLAPIFLLNRDDGEVQRVIESFHVQYEAPQGPELIHIRSAEDVERYLAKDRNILRLGDGSKGEGESRERSPNLAIIVGAIPAITPATPAEHLVYTLTAYILSLPYFPITRTSRPSSFTISSLTAAHALPLPSTPIFLDMAYKPRLTSMLRMASAHGWDTVGGVQAMIEQGLAQQRMWAMSTVDDDVACADVTLLGEEVERRARVLVTEMKDLEFMDEPEVDRAGTINIVS